MNGAEYVKVRGRFARSVNVERDSGGANLDGYLPTSRALDVVGRIGRTISSLSGSPAFSITGPYGTGKSSLAVLIDSLLAPPKSSEYNQAFDILRDVDPELAQTFGNISEQTGSDGFIRSVITATREPISATITRALLTGAERFSPSSKKRELNQIIRDLTDAVEGLQDRNRALPSNRFILDTLERLIQYGPVLILIDEFGKNLEAFSDSRSDADLYLLQEIAEWSTGQLGKGTPFILVTMQHLAFEEYLDSVSQSLRREWAKVQGRFEDVPYVDTPLQTQHLIAQVHTQSKDKKFRTLLNRWVSQQMSDAARAGNSHLIDEQIVSKSWPLHPLSLLVLPELCSRYGQNERTLFSFLASQEPLAVRTWLEATEISSGLAEVRLDAVYDYFIESATTMVRSSQTASRWVEVETIIRDTTDLPESHRRVLKTVGLLNLISTGGEVRASRDIIKWACVDSRPGTQSSESVSKILDELELAGRLTYRSFADEFRLWNGSDIDLRSALEQARRSLLMLPTEDLLSASHDLAPLVAARHSAETGTLRVFDRTWKSGGVVSPLGPNDLADGLLVYVAGDSLPQVATTEFKAKPVIAVRPNGVQDLIDIALELHAIRTVLGNDEILGDDWVARKELTEREAESASRFDQVFEQTMGLQSELQPEWFSLVAGAEPRLLASQVSASGVISQVCDDVYDQSPPVPNEMVNKHELTSQGAKARRVLLTALLRNSADGHFKIEGFPPERAMYDAIFAASGMHTDDSGNYRLSEPDDDSGWAPAWQTVIDCFETAKDHRVGLDRVIDELAQPPIGMKRGAAPILLLTALRVHADHVALYEHGTYTPRMTDDVLERFLRNPAHFQIKHFATSGGIRHVVLTELSKALGGESPTNSQSTVLGVVGRIVVRANQLSGFARATRNIAPELIELRKAIFRATEPDVFLFNTLPEIFGMNKVPIRKTKDSPDPEAFALAVADGLASLLSIRTNLLRDVSETLREAFSCGKKDLRVNLSTRTLALTDKVTDQRMRGLMSALSQDHNSDNDWLEYVAMTLAGPPVDAWTDETYQQFLANALELGAVFKRLEAIHFESLNPHPEAVRHTFTRADGHESARVLVPTGTITDVTIDRVTDFINSAELASVDKSDLFLLMSSLLLQETSDLDVSGK